MDDGFNEPDLAHGDSVLEWLDEIAEAEGLSREAAIQYLISSYWRLEEVVDLLDTGDSRSGSVVESEPSEPLPAPSEINGLHERFDTLLDDIRARDERADERVDVHTALAELGERLEHLEAALEGDSVGQDEPVEDWADELPESHSRLDSLAGDVTAVEDRMDALAESTVTADELDAIIEQTRGFQDSITRKHDSLRDRVVTEFDHIRTVLEHLVETTAANERRADRLAAELRQELRGYLADRETLATITRRANRQGIAAATCEHCGTDVDLSLLQSPDCPNCERAFTDLETTRGLFGLLRSHVLTVSDATGHSNRG